ncbi:hypothetical protein TeGR_g5723 [Tetraparma gracilis]|uniref:Peptide-methionine (R)-S-oxide reductase n=1 Tax=Tetraparma gracilis TaxID=2962635 RepID=A0ABQ6M8Z3_9STRA|nr:hypothetical protein TeGR_g5723 [Tetraparma gracilis]
MRVLSPIVLLSASTTALSFSPLAAPAVSRAAFISTPLRMGLVSSLFGMASGSYAAPVVMGDEALMSAKAHGTSAMPVQSNLRWSCDGKTADRICNFNRHYAEHSGYWETTSFLSEETQSADKEINFYDSNTGDLLFVAPRGRSWDSFVRESKSHGWPSFRDEEVVWDKMRVLPGGEAVSTAGTHLGHNLPDGSGNRYCINLVSVAGRPKEEAK